MATITVMNYSGSAKETKKMNTVDVLQNALCTNFVLYQKLNSFHWNTVGIHFLDLHTFFGDLYDSLGVDIDVIAERIRALDENPVSTLKGFLEKSAIQEEERVNIAETEMLQILLNDYSTIANFLTTNSAYCDKVTENMLLTMIEAVEKTMWKIKSLLK